MPFFVDKSKTGPENFINLVAEDNPKAIYIGGRVELSEPVFDDERGMTKVTVSAIPQQGYTIPDVDVFYNRQPPVEASGSQGKAVIDLDPRPYEQQELIDAIADHLGLIAGDVTIVGLGGDGSIRVPEFEGDNRENYGYQVSAKPGAYLYDDKGEPPFAGTVGSTEKNKPLWFVLPEESLGGFVPRIPSVQFDSFFTDDTLSVF